MSRSGRLTPSLLATAALLAWGALPDDPAKGTSMRWRDLLRNDLPSRVEYEQMEHGYYEQILDAGRHLGTGPLADAANVNSSTGGNPRHERLTLKVNDLREYVLKPNLVRDEIKKICWSTNSFGMRDREYPQAKPAGTFRIGIAGDSIATGWKVDDDAGFEPLLEHAFDARAKAAGGPKVEILNFAVPGHGPGQRWSHFAALGWPFAPDLVIYEATMPTSDGTSAGFGDYSRVASGSTLRSIATPWPPRRSNPGCFPMNIAIFSNLYDGRSWRASIDKPRPTAPRMACPWFSC